jgi:hypothetical protein
VDLNKAYKLGMNGWIYLHVEGEPYNRGYQHGYLMGPRIKEMIGRISLLSRHDLGKDWDFFRGIAERYYAPKVPTEYRSEIEGIVDGAKAGGTNVDYLDVIALNGYMDTHESIGATDFLKKQEQQTKPESSKKVLTSERCSAFIATGSWTKDNEIVMAHNSWWHYLLGSLLNVIMYCKPKSGFEMLMQTSPGLVYPSTDFYLNSAGMIVSSTTIAGVTTYEPNGTPSFVRSRQAMQYSDNIDNWVNAITKDNNGGTPNTWNIGDAKTQEIACLELATYHHKLQKTRDGFFVGSNWALDPEIREKETKFDYLDTSTGAYSRYVRWHQLMRLFRGEINVELAKKFMADHFDTSVNRDAPSRCTICGHIENDLRGDTSLGPYFPAGCFDSKITSSSLALEGAAWIKWGKSCDTSFDAKQFLTAHPEYRWQEPLLQDVLSYPYSLIHIPGGSQFFRKVAQGS